MSSDTGSMSPKQHEDEGSSSSEEDEERFPPTLVGDEGRECTVPEVAILRSFLSGHITASFAGEELMRLPERRGEKLMSIYCLVEQLIVEVQQWQPLIFELMQAIQSIPKTEEFNFDDEVDHRWKSLKGTGWRRNLWFSAEFIEHHILLYQERLASSCTEVSYIASCSWLANCARRKRSLQELSIGILTIRIGLECSPQNTSIDVDVAAACEWLLTCGSLIWCNRLQLGSITFEIERFARSMSVGMDIDSDALTGIYDERWESWKARLGWLADEPNNIQSQTKRIANKTLRQMVKIETCAQESQLTGFLSSEEPIAYGTPEPDNPPLA